MIYILNLKAKRGVRVKKSSVLELKTRKVNRELFSLPFRDRRQNNFNRF